MLQTALADLATLAESLLALLLGGLVGWEREARGKGAGLRTMMLIAFASFLFVEVSLAATAGRAEDVADPVRAIQAIATGLGFVGAGIIFQDASRGRARGITTAATLLTVSPIGIAVALGHYVLAVGATLLLVFTLSAMDRVEDHYLRRRAP
ncbi:MAG: MgtC/SapB family protein [Rubricoccaceae bacterium]